MHGATTTDNPISSVYGGRMLEPSAIHLWTWDARPYPFFPAALDVWKKRKRLGWHRPFRVPPLFLLYFVVFLGVQIQTPFLPLLIGEVYEGPDLPLAIGARDRRRRIPRPRPLRRDVVRQALMILALRATP